MCEKPSRLATFGILQVQISNSTKPTRQTAQISKQPDSRHRRHPPISAQGGIHFGAVTPPNMDQRPTFDPESSLLRESTTLPPAQRACRPTAVPKWIPLSAHMGTYGQLCRSGVVSPTGPSPPDRGVQHRPPSSLPAGYGRAGLSRCRYVWSSAAR
jgi:hypothetical protein